jgi:hypothetical protein
MSTWDDVAQAAQHDLDELLGLVAVASAWNSPFICYSVIPCTLFATVSTQSVVYAINPYRSPRPVACTNSGTGAPRRENAGAWPGRI